MVKKIFVVLLIVLLLSSCAPKQNGPSFIIDDDEYEYNPYNWYQEDDHEEVTEVKTIENSNSWTFEGNGWYQSNIEKKSIDMYEGGGALTSSPFVVAGGSNYSLSFSVNSSADTTINVVIYDSNREYVNKTFVSSGNEERHVFDFYCNVDSYDATIRFNINDVGGANTININNLSVDSDKRNIYCKTNQLGYLTNLEKKGAFFNCQGDYFSVYDQNNNIVYTGPLTKAICNENNNDWLQIAYFKEVKTPGIYYLKGELGSYSKNFVIGDDVYNEISNAALDFIYTQRCGQEISYEDSNEAYHDICHTQNAKIYDDYENNEIEVIGGWHDAGDYGRYLQTTNKVIADLLFSYLYTNNNSQDILDEARYGLEWILKCQKWDGSVYNKITTQVFADSVLPENDDEQLYAMYPWTLTTASFAGDTGLAYIVFKDIDSDFANRCLDAHNKAMDYLKANRYNMIQEFNPSDFATGEYRDGDESDERLFAYAVSYYIKGDRESLKLCAEKYEEAMRNGNKQLTFKMYAMITLLKCVEGNKTIYKEVKSILKSECDQLVYTIMQDAYSYPLEVLLWGSNSYLCDACNKLILGYYLLGNEQYLDKACETINYIMGLNAIDMCFVYGFGDNYPNTTHHRVANIRKTTITGALAGGVDQVLEEGNSGKYISDEVVNAKRFVDKQDCYTNIEPAIYYNSPLVLSLQLLIDANREKQN